MRSPRRREVVTIDLAINRVVIAPIEPRGVVGEYDQATERYTVHLGTQGVHSVRNAIAGTLGVPSRTRCASSPTMSAAASA